MPDPPRDAFRTVAPDVFEYCSTCPRPTPDCPANDPDWFYPEIDRENIRVRLDDGRRVLRSELIRERDRERG